jgi:inorganic pyrophosphatase
MKPPDDFDLLGSIFRTHPWHGVPIGDEAPSIITCYIEIVPTDTVKYELDKESGMIKIDRPQKYSNTCPALYGLVPQTYCRDRVGGRCAEMSGRPAIEGDGDPLDICVFSERPISRGDILMRVKPIGGFRMIDHGEADDKIIAVQLNDPTYGGLEDVSQCPKALIDRLGHYFLTYKEYPGRTPRQVELDATYGRDEAHRVIELAQLDYQEHYSGVYEWAKKLHAALAKPPGEV